MSNSKSDLLNKLKIDTAEAATNTSRINPFVIIAAVAVLVCLFGVVAYYWATRADTPAQTDQYSAQTNIPSSSSSTTQLPQAVSPPKLNEEPPKSTAASPQSQTDNSSVILNASGYITARVIATISAETFGLLQSVDVDEGMQVSEGQVLAKLDDSLAKVDWELSNAQISATHQQINSLQADLKEAQRVLARVQSLDKNSYASEAEVTQAQANVDRLVANIRETQVQLRIAKLRAARQKEVLDDHTIRAPFSGVVTVKAAQAGEIVSPSAICTIVDMNSLEIEVDVNEAYIGRVFEGQKVVAQLDAYPDWDIPASVIAVIPTADRSKATVRVRIRILDKDSRILPDMGVKVGFYQANAS